MEVSFAVLVTNPPGLLREETGGFDDEKAGGDGEDVGGDGEEGRLQTNYSNMLLFRPSRVLDAVP